MICQQAIQDLKKLDIFSDTSEGNATLFQLLKETLKAHLESASNTMDTNFLNDLRRKKVGTNQMEELAKKMKTNHKKREANQPFKRDKQHIDNVLTIIQQMI